MTSPTSPSKLQRPSAVSTFISVDPDYLVFPPPLTGRCIQNTINITNTSSRPCVYKLRSRNPSRYIAKPNVAVVAPKSATRIRVTLPDTAISGDIVAVPSRDTFRIAVKFLSEMPVAGSSARELWDSAGTTIEHEKDITAYFQAGMNPPPGGFVVYLPSNYIPITASRSPSRALSLSAAVETPQRSLRDDMTSAADTSGKRGRAATRATPPTSSAIAGGGNKLVERRGWTAKLRSYCVLVLRTAAIFVVLAYVIGAAARLYTEQQRQEKTPVAPADAASP